jgi:hypothetical protein
MTSYTPEYSQLQAMDELSRNDTYVQMMVNDHLPFTRETWMDLYDPGRELTWDGEREMAVPPIFRVLVDEKGQPIEEPFYDDLGFD